MLSLDFLGIHIKSPLMLTEGPLSGTEELILKAFESDTGLIFTKGIRPEPVESPVPYMALYGDGLMNADWSCMGINTWERCFSRIGRDLPLVASIAKNYVTPETAVEMAGRLQSAGARIISFVDYNPDELIRTVRMARPKIKVPLMVKLPPFLPRLEENLRDLTRAGIDAVAAMDSIGPVLSIDVDTGKPLLGSVDGSGYLSGYSILPVTVKYIYDITGFVDVPVVGVGGVTDGPSAVQMMMAGATGVGLMTQPMLKGLAVYTKASRWIAAFMEEKGYHSPADFRGLTRDYNSSREISSKLKASIDPELCILCGKCEKICYSRAIRKDAQTFCVDSARCIGCGLCAGVCPVRAIEYIRTDAGAI